MVIDSKGCSKKRTNAVIKLVNKTQKTKKPFKINKLKRPCRRKTAYSKSPLPSLDAIMCYINCIEMTHFMSLPPVITRNKRMMQVIVS